MHFHLHARLLRENCGILFIPRAGITSYHKLSSLKEQKFILPQFWRLQAWNQGVSRVGSLWGSDGEPGPFLSSSFSWLSAIFGVFGLWEHHSNLCLCLHMTSSLYCCMSMGFRAHPKYWVPNICIIRHMHKRKKYCQPKILFPAKICFTNKGEINVSADT